MPDPKDMEDTIDSSDGGASGGGFAAAIVSSSFPVGVTTAEGNEMSVDTSFRVAPQSFVERQFSVLWRHPPGFKGGRSENPAPHRIPPC